jgi:hypothetical protein
LKGRVEKIEAGTAEWRKDLESMQSGSLDTTTILKVISSFKTNDFVTIKQMEDRTAEVMDAIV